MWNPWLLAGLVFGAIGLIVEAVQSKDNKTAAEKAAATKAAAVKKKAKKAAKPAVTETHPQPPVVVNLTSEKPVAKPTGEVLTETPTQE